MLAHRRAGEQNRAAPPLVEFSVPIAEGKTAATIVRAGRVIDKYLVTEIGTSSQSGIVNTINALVGHEEDLGRAGSPEAAGFAKGCVGSAHA